MQNATFQTLTHAKCILAGEHAVLRGCPALVLPVTQKTLTLFYQDNEEQSQALINSPYEEVFSLLFWHTLDKGLLNLHKKLRLSDIHGKFYLENNIEIGAGLGFSAALCVAITRWLIWEHWLRQKKLYAFAHHLEDIFHGKSSGVDIAGVMSNTLIHFEISGKIHEIQPQWKPKLYLSYSGISKSTDSTIHKVNALRKENPQFGNLIDKEMKKSVLLIEEALKNTEKDGLNTLVSALQQANHCFKEWDLITPDLQKHLDKLEELGAIAVKPTGAGAGGYVLSLWKKTPPQEILNELCPLHLKM